MITTKYFYLSPPRPSLNTFFEFPQIRGILAYEEPPQKALPSIPSTYSSFSKALPSTPKQTLGWIYFEVHNHIKYDLIGPFHIELDYLNTIRLAVHAHAYQRCSYMLLNSMGSDFVFDL
jgi:hypothetical protein